MFISQDLFDETLLESQELLETTDEDAVAEAISELQSSHGGKIGLDHLSLTHPHSVQGKHERLRRNEFVVAVKAGEFPRARSFAEPQQKSDDASNAVESGIRAEKKKSLFVCQTLLLHEDLLPSLFSLFEINGEAQNDSIQSSIEFLAAMLRQTTIATPAIQSRMTDPIKRHWFRLYNEYPTLRIGLVRWARLSCNSCEVNKKAFVQTGISYRTGEAKKNGLDLILGSLPDHLCFASNESSHADGKENTNQATSLEQQELKLVNEICLLISILGRFQTSEETRQPHKSHLGGKQQEEPLVSSAHANVLEFYRCHAVPKLHRLAEEMLNSKQNVCGYVNIDLTTSILSALRVMAIDNDIVQSMVAVGILETAEASLLTFSSYSNTEDMESGMEHSSALASSTLGLLRNLCANDEIKNNVCKRSLLSILHTMELHASNHTVQEQGCGILAAMALREPLNAKAIIAANGPHFIIQAMLSFPAKVPLQRQGALSLRNLASRLSAGEKNVLLDCGAENVLRGVTARHQGSIEEAYAALRDLGCEVLMYNIDENGNAQGTQVFGQVQSNFRPVYD